MSEHPSVQLLADFGHGRLDHDLHVQIEEHVCSCEACRSFLTDLPHDRFAQLFRSAVPESPVTRPTQSRYELLNELGRGGMGVVFRARDRQLNRLVAIKKIKSGSLANRNEQELFLREAGIVARLIHPGIVQLYEVGEETSDDGLPVPFFVMELVEGDSLAQRLQRGLLPEKQAVELVETLARTMHFAHQRGILHRDLKPSNILLSSQDISFQSAKIADFGLAKLLQIQSPHATLAERAILGTPGYMAPEQIRPGSAELGPATDVFALGAILYECLTGHAPYPKDSSLPSLEAVVQQDPKPVREWLPTVSPELEAICLKCLQQLPEDRYSTALALAEDLARWRRHEPVLARPASTVQKVRKWVRRHPWPTALLGMIVLMVAGVLGGLTIYALKQKQAVTRIEKERKRADDNYRNARQTISQMLARIQEMNSKKQAGVREFHRKQLEDVLAFHEKTLQDVDANQPQVQLDTASTLIEVATLQTTLGSHAQAQASLQRAIQLLDQQADETEPVLGARLLAWNKLGTVQHSMGSASEAIESYQRSLVYARRLQEAFPHIVFYRADIAWCHHNLGVALVGKKQLPQAQVEFEQAVAMRRDMLQSQIHIPFLKQYLAESQVNLAMVLHQQSHRNEAEQQYAEAEQSMRQVVSDWPDSLETITSLAALLLNKGNVLLELGRIEEALKSYREGLVQVQSVLAQEPLLAFARELQLSLNGACANLLDKTGKSAEAIPHWDEVVKLSGKTRLYRCMRVTSLAQAGMIDKALAELRDIPREPALGTFESQLLLQAAETIDKTAPSPDARRSIQHLMTSLRKSMNEKSGK